MSDGRYLVEVSETRYHKLVLAAESLMQAQALAEAEIADEGAALDHVLGSWEGDSEINVGYMEALEDDAAFEKAMAND